MKKAQASTEYLIILAVVIIVALIVVGIMGWFPGIGGQVGVKQSQAYWEATTPLAIVDYSISGTDADLVLENKEEDQLNISAITLEGTNMGFSATTITGGEQVTVNGTSPQCTTGDQFSFEVTLTYDNLDTGITGKTFTGTTDLKGQCG